MPSFSPYEAVEIFLDLLVLQTSIHSANLRQRALQPAPGRTFEKQVDVPDTELIILPIVRNKLLLGPENIRGYS